MPREYSLLAEDILKYDPRLIMTGGGGVDLRAKGANLLGKSTPYPEKEKEKRDTEEMVGEMIESIAKGGDYSNAGYESANWAGQYSDMDVLGREPDTSSYSGWGESFLGDPSSGVSGSFDSGGGSFGGGSSGGGDIDWGAWGMAQGGPVQEGQPYVVGEEGAEMFVPNQSGTIVPNQNLDAGQLIENFYRDIFSPQPNMGVDQFNQQHPSLMPRDSNIAGITPVPQSPMPSPLPAQRFIG